ncbi:MAG: sigma factor [Limisphaerales bacterium]
MDEALVLAFISTVAELIKLVRTYRVTAGLAERLRLAEEIFRQIEPDLRFFVFGAVSLPAGEDVLQEVLKAVTVSLKKFEGDTHEVFWAWCYRIARNKINDHLRKQISDRAERHHRKNSGNWRKCKTPRCRLPTSWTWNTP